MLLFFFHESGTQYIINKLDNKTMKFQQVSKKGMLGTLVQLIP